MYKLPTLNELRSALIDLKSRYLSIEPEEAEWALSNERIELILSKLPYTNRMLEYLFGIQNSTHGKMGILSAIAEVVNQVSPHLIFDIDNSSAIVLKDGSSFVVNTNNMSCSCGDNSYYNGRKEFYGMCSHLAKVIFYSTNPALQEINIRSEGLIKRHVESNTSDVISNLKLLGKKTLNDFDVSIKRHCDRFIYVSYRGTKYSYYEPGLFWCFAPCPPGESIASDLELFVLEEIFHVELQKPNLCKVAIKDISNYDYEIRFFRENSINGAHKEFEKIFVSFQRKPKTKQLEILFHLGYKKFKLKYYTTSMHYTKGALKLLPEALKKYYLPFVTKTLINLDLSPNLKS